MQKRALLIGAPIAHRADRRLPGVANDIDTAAGILAGYGFECARLLGAAAHRDQILAALDDLAGSASAEDAIVLYYSGHGGQIRNVGVRTPDLRVRGQTPRYHQFLVPEDYYERIEAGEFGGVLDIELAHAAARMAERTRNITVILDCCHSGGQVRRSGRAVAKGLPKDEFRGKERRWNPLIARRLEALAARIQDRGWPALAPDAHPHIVRIEASRSDELAREIIIDGRRRGALTAAWADAMERYRGQPITWHAVIAHINACLDTYPDCGQHAGLGGPGHRLVFQLDEAPGVGAAPVIRKGEDWYLRGGTITGMRAGDRFIIVPATAERADPDQALAHARVIEVGPDMARVELDGADAGMHDAMSARAFAVASTAPWRGVVVKARGAVRDALIRRIEATGALSVCHAGDPAVAVLTELASPDGLIEVGDGRGVPIARPVSSAETAVALAQRLQRAALLRAQQSGQDEHALAIPFEVRWQRAGSESTIHGVHSQGEPMAAVEIAEVGEGDEIECSIQNSAQVRKKSCDTLYITVFDVDVDGRVTRRTAAESSGVSLRPGDIHVLGYRPHSGHTLLPMSWPADMPRTATGLRSLVIIAADRPHDVCGLETCDLDAYGVTMTPSLLDVARTPAAELTRGRGSAESVLAMRYAVVRLDWHVTPRT